MRAYKASAGSSLGAGDSFFLLFFEILVFPNVLAEIRIDDVTRVEDDFVKARLEVSHPQIGASGLQRVKKKAGGFVLDLVRDEQAHDLHKGDLDGVGVFEDGQNKSRDAPFAVGGEFDGFVLKALVDETETIAAECWRSTLSAVDFQMLTAVWVICHEASSPSPADLLESSV